MLWLIPGLPFAGTVILALTGTRLTRGMVPVIGAGSVGISALVTLVVGLDFLTTSTQSYQQVVWNWIEAFGFGVNISFHLDALSLAFIFIITFVGFLIHLYSAEFMVDEEGYARF
ncbi:MAG TPA: NADH-quinone oxidoreductase subunit L, partial [Cyclobacteriaceae bacterium]|nr:NADH-quinone oxidoreductase subunit L [Cyclobacteriaceae bacterium]